MGMGNASRGPWSGEWNWGWAWWNGQKPLAQSGGGGRLQPALVLGATTSPNYPGQSSSALALCQIQSHGTFRRRDWHLEHLYTAALRSVLSSHRHSVNGR